jgi:hypothetical protein
MLRDMLHRVLDNTTGVIVVEAESELSRVREVFRQVQIDWLVVNSTQDGRLPQQAHQLLNHVATLSLLALSQDGNQIDIRLKTGEGKVARYNLMDVTLAGLLSILCYKQGDIRLPELLQRRWPAASHREGIKEVGSDSLRAVHRAWPGRAAARFR